MAGRRHQRGRPHRSPHYCRNCKSHRQLAYKLPNSVTQLTLRVNGCVDAFITSHPIGGGRTLLTRGRFDASWLRSGPSVEQRRSIIALLPDLSNL
jgi:hypothetical protein